MPEPTTIGHYSRHDAATDDVTSDPGSSPTPGPDLTDPINYDLQPVRVPVTYRGRRFVLTESGDAVVKYRNASISAARMRDGKVVGLSGAADAEPILVAGCLFENADPDLLPRADRPVSPAFVRGLPSRLTAKLFDRAREINGIKDEETVTKIDDQIALLQRRRAELVAEKEGANGGTGSGKDGTPNTTSGSD